MLEAAELRCDRGGRTLFRGLSFRLGGGELLRIAGANGRGKTSLLRILCGLLAPAAGEVRWKGASIGPLKEEYWSELVYLGHAPALKDELTAEENLSIACALTGAPARRADVGDALARLEVPQGVFLKKLSQGQRRRAALARLVLSAAAPLWLLDEPFAALDAHAARAVETLVSEHVARGGAAVFTTHQEARLKGREISLDG
jgi:heme exporter protein A